MQTSRLCQSVVVREGPARHCFLSLPRSWLHLVHPAHTPTFKLELSSGSSAVLSWAGDMHSSEYEIENTVIVGREVLRGSGISDGEVGIITQVATPPPSNSVSVSVKSPLHWEDLALNVDSAQSCFLEQVRVLSHGQTVPLWLEGGVCVMLTVTATQPDCYAVLLQPMTRVEVIPPGATEDFQECGKINFTPGDKEASVEQGLKQVTSVKQIQEFTHLEPNYLDPKNVIANKKREFEKLLRNVLLYMNSRLNEPSLYNFKTYVNEFSIGCRVSSFPLHKKYFMSKVLQTHPSLVIVSRNCLPNSKVKFEKYFIASVRKVHSPRENSEKNKNKEDGAGSSAEKKNTDKSIDKSDYHEGKLLTVIIWENFIAGRNEDEEFIREMKTLLRRKQCVVTDPSRRQMGLEVTSMVDIRFKDIAVNTMPVSIDVIPMSYIEDSKREELLDNLKTLLMDITMECVVIINSHTMMGLSVGGTNVDLLLTTRTGMPLKLTKESSVILELTFVATNQDLPHVPSSVLDFDPHISAKHLYLGEEEVMKTVKYHVLSSLGLGSVAHSSVPQFALLSGAKGCGKTSLLETVIKEISGPPYFVHCHTMGFKLLKGKKVDTIEKKLHLCLKEAIFRRPSLVVLEDLDYLVPRDGAGDQEAGPVFEHTMQLLAMIKRLLDQLAQFLHVDDQQGSVMVIGSCITRTNVHPELVNPQGHHYFPCTFRIAPMEPEGRTKAFAAMLNSFVKSYFELKQENTSTINQFSISIDKQIENAHLNKLITKKTEGFVLPDLSHFAFRTFLHARERWEGIKHCVDGDAVDVEAQDCSTILPQDIEAALEGYVSLALRGIALSEKKMDTAIRVGGLRAARSTLDETLRWPSEYPGLFGSVALRLRSGVLLYGPPGCGKTLLAHAITADCQLNFISVKGPELLSKYIGASEQAVRDAFERASSAKPCVLFFDEFESIAPRRGHDSTGVTDRVVNQLLTQMDGVEGLSGVYVLAATSRPDLIDPALLRPGRLDKCVYCPMPGKQDREEILQVLSKDIDMGEEIDWSEIASITEHFSGADLQSVLSTAQVLVAQEALGDAMYTGVIDPPTQDKEALEADSDVDPMSVAEYRDYTDKNQEQIIIEKEKVNYNNGKKEKQNDEEETNKITLISENINIKQEKDKHSNIDQKEAPVFKIYLKHIEAALGQVKPSVTQADRRRYEQLYSSFTQSRDGNFGQPSPGKRATLA